MERPIELAYGSHARSVPSCILLLAPDGNSRLLEVQSVHAGPHHDGWDHTGIETGQQLCVLSKECFKLPLHMGALLSGSTCLHERFVPIRHVLCLLQLAVRQASHQLLRLRRGRTQLFFRLSKRPADFGHVGRLAIVGIDDLLQVLLNLGALISPSNLCVSQSLASDLDCTVADRGQRCVRLRSVVVREYARLTTAPVAQPTLDQVQILESAFEWLCKESARLRQSGASLVQLDDRRWLRLDNYVGVVEAP